MLVTVSAARVCVVVDVEKRVDVIVSAEALSVM